MCPYFGNALDLVLYPTTLENLAQVCTAPSRFLACNETATLASMRIGAGIKT
jgi:hypothetical protein